MSLNVEHIKWFRDSSPYIDAHRGKTFVVYLPSQAISSTNLDNIVSDFALLNSLGVRLVVVFECENEIETRLKAEAFNWPKNGQARVTLPEHMPIITATLGQVATELTAKLSTSVLNLPISRVESRSVDIVSGNFVRAKPLGVIDGVDYHRSGAVRSVNRTTIALGLDSRAIVLVSPLGFSLSGETFYLEADALARDIACQLVADKLIYMDAAPGLKNADGDVINEIDLSDPAQFNSDEPMVRLLAHCGHACGRGVPRCHIVSCINDGAILEELFTRDGCGTQVVGKSYEQIRAATAIDVPGILKLIEPMENAGILVKRSRELLESEFSHFVVIERDGLLVSCAALYPSGETAELACLVTHPDYRNSDRGDRLLDTIEIKAKAIGTKTLFVLTTQSAHWFSDRGFVEGTLDALPQEKQALYNYQRNSKILTKEL